MTDGELLIAVKQYLGYEIESLDEFALDDGCNAVDDGLMLKIKGVKYFMIGAGVSESVVCSDLGISTIAMGVNDVSSLSSGEVKLSAALQMFINQLSRG